MRVGGQRYYPREGAPVPTVQEAGWSPRSVCAGAENVSATVVRSLNRLNRSDSLYRLSPPSPLFGVLIITTLINCNIWLHVITDLWVCKGSLCRSVAVCSGLSGGFLKFGEIWFTVQVQRNRKPNSSHQHYENKSVTAVQGASPCLSVVRIACVSKIQSVWMLEQVEMRLCKYRIFSNLIRTLFTVSEG